MDPDFPVDAEIDEIEDTPTTRRGTAKKKVPCPGGEIKDFHKHFADIGFTSTFYPHKETLEELGLLTDVGDILTECGIETFAYKPFPTYAKVAAEFLATLRVHDVKDEILADKYGGGMISFKVLGQGKSLEFKEIDEFFGFKRGEAKHQNVDKDQLNRVWKMLTTQDAMPRQAKSSMIRNPALNYARRVIAETFYSRKVTGPVNCNDMQLLTNGFASLVTLPDPIIGDVAGAGMTFLLCKHLESLKGKAQAYYKKGYTMEEMTVGGTITGLLTLAMGGVTDDFGEATPPQFMDLEYLHARDFLVGIKGGAKHYYRLQTSPTTSSAFALPNPDYANIMTKRNIRFDPPEDMLIDIDTLPAPPAIDTAKEAGTSRQPHKKRKVAATPPGRGPVAQLCACTRAGYREEMVAEIRAGMVDEIRAAAIAEIRASMLDDIRAGLIEEIRAAVTTEVQEQARRDIADGIEKGLAALSRDFVKKSEILPPPHTRTSQASPTTHVTPALQSAEAPVIRSTTGSTTKTRVLVDDSDSEEDIRTAARAKKIPIIKLKRTQGPKKA